METTTTIWRHTDTDGWHREQATWVGRPRNPRSGFGCIMGAAGVYRFADGEILHAAAGSDGDLACDGYTAWEGIEDALPADDVEQRVEQRDAMRASMMRTAIPGPSID